MKRWWMLIGCLASLAAQAADQTYAWLEKEADQASVHVVRSHQPVIYSATLGFAACDEISLKSGAVFPVAIATADGTRLVLDVSTPSVKLPCRTRAGLGQEALRFIQALLAKSNQRAPVSAMTRGAGGACSRELRMPLLSQGENTPTVVSAGSRPLVLAWSGGGHPFSVQIDSSEGTVLQIGSLKDPLYEADVELAPGRYRLRLSDSCHHQLEDDFLQIVPPTERPPMPSQIAALPEPGRSIYYADYLLGYGDGRWGLEALQLVARRAKSEPAAHDWVMRWTGSP